MKTCSMPQARVMSGHSVIRTVTFVMQGVLSKMPGGLPRQVKRASPSHKLQ